MGIRIAMRNERDTIEPTLLIEECNGVGYRSDDLMRRRLSIGPGQLALKSL